MSLYWNPIIDLLPCCYFRLSQAVDVGEDDGQYRAEPSNSTIFSRNRTYSLPAAYLIFQMSVVPYEQLRAEDAWLTHLRACVFRYGSVVLVWNYRLRLVWKYCRDVETTFHTICEVLVTRGIIPLYVCKLYWTVIVTTFTRTMARTK